MEYFTPPHVFRVSALLKIFLKSTFDLFFKTSLTHTSCTLAFWSHPHYVISDDHFQIENNEWQFICFLTRPQRSFTHSRSFRKLSLAKVIHWHLFPGKRETWISLSDKVYADQNPGLTSSGYKLLNLHSFNFHKLPNHARFQLSGILR